MGNTQSMQKINFEDMSNAVKNSNRYLIINTLPDSQQNCLIVGTTPSSDEEYIINRYLQTNKSITIIIYGKNCNDEKITKKYQQLYSLGFYNIYAYTGGLFEWLLLQDVYGKELFPTTSKEVDILKFKPQSCLQTRSDLLLTE